ncbi:MAG: UDP-galactopyranose mutase [Deltaproteobacteria bacterium]|nr:UDP-galactopyranose mutase [Deltaproteobacteria bacterium]
MTQRWDAVVVGAGFAGAILAERLASQQGKRVVLLERRKHLGGNMYDRPDHTGILVHVYGPHIFRTDSPRVLEYLSQFTEWRAYEHKVLASVDGQLVPVPFNLVSLEKLLPKQKAERLEKKLLARYAYDAKVPVYDLRHHEDAQIRELGEFIFQKIYLNYTVKQWGDRPENLDFATITKRVPVRLSHDDRYFQQQSQGMPKAGYTRLFERMLAHPNIELRLGVDATSVLSLDEASGKILFEGQPFEGTVIYSGALDELFGSRYGELAWRSLRFEVKTVDQDFFQPVAVVNYPNDHEYTRITEFKHLTGQPVRGVTTYCEEYPLAYERRRGHEPYYPIPKAENDAAHRRYLEAAQRFANLIVIGRLAEYRYYDMNDIILRALDQFEKMKG